MGASFLQDLLTLTGIALLVTFICDRIKIPSIVGYLITGILAGPNVLGWVREIATVQTMAEIGVILLLFTTGIDFSFKSLKSMKLAFFGGGSLQLFLTIGAATVLLLALNRPADEAFFFGMIISLSCTAIALKLLTRRAEMDAPHGRLSLGILVFQDVMVVPMVLIIPLLAATGTSADFDLVSALPMFALKALGLIAVTYIAARYLCPWVFFQISAMRDTEVFLLSVVAIGLGVATLTAWAGLSLALGAFLAGLIISESEYSHRALGSILPFKDIFMSIFFISIGMLLDPSVLLTDPLMVAGLTIFVLTLKILMATIAVLICGYPPKVALLTAFAISGIGEFSFVLAKMGTESGLMSESLYQEFLATSVLSLIAAPIFITLGPKLLSKARIDRMSDTVYTGESDTVLPAGKVLRDHIIIVGYGPTGRYTARAAAAADIPYLIIELNPMTVREQRKLGEPIVYGDATQDITLEKAGIASARVLLIVVPDPAATRQITKIARELNPTVTILVRVRFLSEMEPLKKLGASEVIPEEFETAIEILARTLKRYLMSPEKIEEFVAQIRADGYRMLRSHSLGELREAKLRSYLPDVEINLIKVSEREHMIGKNLLELDLRNRFGVTVLAIRRCGETIQNPNPELLLEMDDELVVLGMPQKLSGMVRKLTDFPIEPVK
jgi:monovalent cation:H+ antiporter-2, CPA2 family